VQQPGSCEQQWMWRLSGCRTTVVGTMAVAEECSPGRCHSTCTTSTMPAAHGSWQLLLLLGC
jgi:hypothetical protein